MAFDANFAPFIAQYALAVDQERAAHDPHDFAAIHVFFMDNVKLCAEFFLGIRQQVERKLLLGFEIFVGFQAVPGHTQNGCVQRLELVVKISEITGIEGDVISMHDLFEFQTTGINQDGDTEGFFCATGLRPNLL